VRRKRTEMWKKKNSWILHHDNTLSIKKHKIPELEHPPYSPDLAPCDFFLFPKIKSALKGNHFTSIDAVKA
jgi:transposase